jgi:alpha-1,6-mannosyltransferase
MPACDDMYRYLWEGKVIGLGYSPFRLAPNAPALIPFRDSTWAFINHPDLPTLYPLFSEALFALLAKLAKAEWLFKVAFVAFDVGTFVFLRKLVRNANGTYSGEAQRIQASYFLNPLLILEIAGRGHLDSVIVFFNVVFLWALQTKRGWSPASLALGAMSKINSLALAPLLFLQMPWKRAVSWSIGIGCVIGISLFATGMIDTLNRFTTKFSYNNIMPFLIERSMPFLTAQSHHLIGGILLGLSGLTLFWRLRNAKIAQQALGFMGLLLVFSPTIHTWYLLWILPFAALTLSRPWLLCSGTIMISYIVVGQAYTSGHWQERPWLKIPEFLVPLIFGLVLYFKNRKLKS